MEPLGDRVAYMLQQLGVKPCPPCKARQEALNKLDKKVRHILGKGGVGNGEENGKQGSEAGR